MLGKMKNAGLVLLCLFILSCAKEDENRIPNVPVSFRASLQDPRLSRLSSPGGAVAIEGYGVAGLIIYRSPAGYVAFDRCSSVNPRQRCPVTIDEGSLTASDKCSGAVFSLQDGAPMKLPAKRPLKQYLVNISSFEISVIN